MTIAPPKQQTRNSGTPLPYLAAWRKHACLTQKALAEQADLNVYTIIGIEVGRYRATLRSLNKLATALRVPARTLIDEMPPVNHAEAVSHPAQLLEALEEYLVERVIERLHAMEGEKRNEAGR